MKSRKVAKKATRKAPVLKITSLEAGYGDLQVLKGIDMSIQKGGFVVIIGPNGSGKSTTIKSIFALTTKYKGKITLNGKDITRMATHEIVRMGVGYVPQGRLVFEALTVEENLEMGCYNLTKAEMTTRKERIYNLFPVVKEKRKAQAGLLSGGQQQQLSIGRALMQEPKLLLLDEPSLGLDPITQQLIFKTIKEISTQGTTIMMVEQNARQALKICTKAYVIEQGRVAAVGGPELAKRKKIQELYLGGR